MNTMKQIKKAGFFLFATCWLGMISTLIACTADRSDMTADKYFNQTSDSAMQKTFSNATSAEYERMGDQYFARNDLVKAFLNYDKAHKLGPENSSVQYKKGLALVAGNINEGAIKEFQAVIKRDPGYALAYEGLGLAYYQMKEFDKSEKKFKKAIELNPKLWKSHNFLGILYDQQKKHKLAIEQYYDAFMLKPDEGLLYNNFGVSYYLAGNYTIAVNAFEKAIAYGYSVNKINNNLGLALARLGRYEEALLAFRKGGDKARAYNNIGCIYLEQGKFDKAIDSFTKAIEASPLYYPKASDNLQKARRAYRERTPPSKSNGFGE